MRRFDLIITRHKGLVEYLVNKGILNGNETVIEHATLDMIRGKNIIGVLPVSMAAEAASVTMVNMVIPPEMRGIELDAEQVAQFSTGEIVTYKVTAIDRL